MNSTSFDDLSGIAALKSEYNFWLHVDAAFGMFAACSPKYAHLVNGIDKADSITIDAHKWLNVPYDSGIQFCRHPVLQRNVFQNSNAAYLGNQPGMTDYMNRTPETSRRLRALTVWFTLMAYGKRGYQEIVERNCEMAQKLAGYIQASEQFTLLAHTTLNVVCFTLNTGSGNPSKENINRFLNRLTDAGEVFMTPTEYKDAYGIRAAICNWRTTHEDIEISWKALNKTYREFEDRASG